MSIDVSDLTLPPGFDPDAGETLYKTGQPAVGDNTRIQLLVPGGEAWLLRSISAIGDTDANVGSRHLSILIHDNNKLGGVYTNAAMVYSDFPAPIPASTTFQWSFFLGGQPTSEDSGSGEMAFNGALPMLVVPTGFWITAAMDFTFAGDRICQPAGTGQTGVSYSYTRWFSGTGTQGGGDQNGPYMYVPGPSATTA